MEPSYIAFHILNECIGDDCECVGWPHEDRETLEAMSIERAEELAFPEDRREFDYDMSDDAEALASAGWGTDEDYGYCGDCE